MRLFIAVDLPEEVRSYLGSFKSLFPDLHGKVSWVRPENIHITLKFLGEVADSKTAGIAERLNKIKFLTFSLTLNTFGFFPRENALRVFWINFVAAARLRALSREIDKVLPEFRNDRSFKDHVTLARIKTVSPLERSSFLEKISSLQLERKEFVVDKFVLYRSTLTPRGSVYEPIFSFKSC